MACMKTWSQWHTPRETAADLRIDALLLCGAILALGLGIAQGRPVLGVADVQVSAVSVQQLDHVHAAVDGPEQGEVASAILPIGVSPCPQQRPGALQAPSVACHHQRCIPLVTPAVQQHLIRQQLCNVGLRWSEV